MKSSAMYWVIDANLAVRAFLPGPQRVEAVVLLERGGVIAVPALWVYEVTSALHKTLWANQAWKATAESVLGDILALPDDILPPDEAQVRVALNWADRLVQAKAYDAFYLALAEGLGAEFWTGDQRLVNRARQVGADFVRLLGVGRGLRCAGSCASVRSMTTRAWGRGDWRVAPTVCPRPGGGVVRARAKRVAWWERVVVKLCSAVVCDVLRPPPRKGQKGLWEGGRLQNRALRYGSGASDPKEGPFSAKKWGAGRQCPKTNNARKGIRTSWPRRLAWAAQRPPEWGSRTRSG